MRRTHFTKRTAITLVLLPALFCLPLVGATIPGARPEEVGLSRDRLQRIHETIQRHMDAGEISGAVTLVARRGRVAHFEAHGMMDIATKKPMSRDAIFRLASMSKPVTGAAVMMLIEEGKVRLTDPVSKFTPEFKGMKVAVPKESSAGPARAGSLVPQALTVPANREITIRDLLTHTSGMFRGALTLSASGSAQVDRKPTDSLADYVPRLGALPLAFQPGTRWSYSAGDGFDTLGRIVEIASGQSFDEFLRRRMFEPLGMKDTFFWAPDDRRSRVPSVYTRTAQGLVKEETQDRVLSRTFSSGSGGLMSTAEDFLQFCQMLLDGGQLNGKRLLGPRSVDLMASVHVPDTVEGRTPGQGFGLSVRVITDPVAAGSTLSKGSYGWGGVFGTRYWIDPKTKIVGILMMQNGIYEEVIRGDFEDAVMQAVVE